MNIGKAIKMCRHQRSLSQAELAKKTGLSISYLSLLERNKRDITISSLKKITESLNIPISILLFLASDKNDLKELDNDIIEKLSKVVLELMDDEKYSGQI